MSKKAASESTFMSGSAVRRAVAAGLLCAVLAACGTRHAGEAAAPPSPVPAHEPCGLDLDLTTDDDGAGNAGPPTDEETGYAGPPTDQETGYAGPPTDQETGYAGPPTDQETGYAGPPTDQDTAAPDPSTTDPDVTNGAGPCGGAGWFDMTRDFNAYYAEHRTPQDRLLPAQAVQQAKVRTAGGAGEAVVTFRTGSVGKGLGEDARRVAQVFAAWRQQVYGDKGTVSVRTTGGEVVTTAPW
ncbi:hypothetical protein ABZ128_04955 [Streptomyces sp. NPDC006326]|uniref:hypothetical protein n=1 Tax=Streptomyces sp. NPDC006326 TaxID=3156752 RepID=UPI0033A5FF90